MRISGRALYGIAVTGVAALWGFIGYYNYNIVRAKEDEEIKEVKSRNLTRRLEAMEEGKSADEVFQEAVPEKMSMPEAIVETIKYTGREVWHDICEDPWNVVIKPGLIGAGVGFLYLVGYNDGGTEYYQKGYDEGELEGNKDGFSWGYANGVRHIAGWAEHSLSDNPSVLNYVADKMETYKKTHSDEVDWIHNVHTYPDEQMISDKANELRRTLG